MFLRSLCHVSPVYVVLRGVCLAACVAAGFAVLVQVPAAPAYAEEGSGYRTPPEPLADLVDRPPTPWVLPGPGHEQMLLLERPNLPPIQELAEPELRLGGLRFHPRQDAPSRRRPANGLALVTIADGVERPVAGLPENPRIDDVVFSPDGTHVAFTHTLDDGAELWLLDVATAEARRLGGARLSLAARVAPVWLPDGRSLVVTLVPEDRGPAPAAPTVPAGPVIQANTGDKAPARTYQDLLEDAHDEALFAHYLTARLACVDLDGKITKLGEPALFWEVNPSPDGRYLLVETLHRPFSYLVPARRFPLRVEVWSRDGDTVAEIADLPLQEGVPIAFGSVPAGPRSFSWRADAPATLVWAEALDGGDAGREAELRDRLFLLAAPFDGEPTPWLELELRYGGVLWGRDDLALVSSWWWKTRRQRVERAAPGSPDEPAETVFDHSWEDRYADPGSPVTVANDRGRQVLLMGDEVGENGTTIFLIGDGASPEGDRPFLDAHDLASGESRRLFRSEAPYYERPVELLDGAGRLLTRRESVDEPPNYFLRNLERAGEPRRLTEFPHPTPELAGLTKELIRYKRDDGVELTATLYLPPGHDLEGDDPLPMLMWAYPQEFKSADAAGQVTDSPYRFARVGWWSPLIWLTRGYAVLDDPSMPIVGEGDVEPNDSFRRQLVQSASAAVEEVVRRGAAKRDQIAIGGHSYGAFMTANLLAHSDLFAAGIARSGAYNRTLTPFGFQSEERTLWDAPEVYFTMSPFMHAEKVDEPILLIHGAADNNSGTFPMQSERFYSALKGHGATARLVMLPHESHGYRARESVLHMLWETDRWLEDHVKDAGLNPAGDEVPNVERGQTLEGTQP